MSKTLFNIDDIHVEIDEKVVVNGVSLEIKPGEKHAIMGPNGSGKSSLVNAMMGHPKYEITKGSIIIDGEDITNLEVNEKAQKGMFLGMQYPLAIPGVTVANFLRTAIKSFPDGESRVKTFRKDLKKFFKTLEVPEEFATRYINDGFSGGEKKRLEILQLGMLKPKVALLDETDSGLDIDALQIVSEGINKFCGDDVALLMVTHYQRMLNYVKPTHIHVFMNGRIVKSGGPELALELEERGYDWVEKEVEENAEAV